MEDALKQEAYEANMMLPRFGLVRLTWGNASALDRNRGLLAIKPSGVSYEVLTAADMVLVDLEGQTIGNGLKPSSDTPTHVRLYQAFPEIGGVVHTHSPGATAFAQAGRPVPCYGTTHADYFHGEVPVTRPLTREEVDTEYEWNTGAVIAACHGSRDALGTPGALVHSHGPFTWGRSAASAAEHAAVLETISAMALHSLALNPQLAPVPHYLLDRHVRRKHGRDAYYGK